jgi:hypothetical protein
MKTLTKTGAGIAATIALGFAGGAALASSLSNDDTSYIYEEVTHDGGMEQVEMAVFEFEGPLSNDDTSYIYEDSRQGDSEWRASDPIGVDELNSDNW